GAGETEGGAERAPRPGADAPRHQGHVRREGPGRPGAAPDRRRLRLGREPQKRRPLSERHAEQERRDDRLQAHGPGRPRRRLLVDQRLRRQGLLPEEPVRRLHAQQPHGEEERRRLGRRAVRRLRRQTPQLPADHARLELHGAPLPSACRDPRRDVELFRATAGVVANLSDHWRAFVAPAACWRAPRNTLLVEPSGTLVAGGYARGSTTCNDGLAVGLDPATGARLWSRTVDGTLSTQR